jgi:phage shock protein PspC (stress-responsive transcriptional regulator)
MKKTLSVNLNGTVYHIDEDAYQILMDYLQNVKTHLESSSADEVLSDIEMRISELFAQWMQAKREVITLDDVQRVIRILGRPEQFDTQAESADSAQGEEPTDREQCYAKTDSKNAYSSRRMYRDTDNAFLGGVCAGIAAYLDVSIVLIRLLMLILILLWGMGLLFYLAAWIIIPEARTVAQRLEMIGEDVTIENIEKKVREEAGKVRDRVDGYVRSGRFRNNAQGVGNGFLVVLRVFVKVLLAIIGGILTLSGFFVLLSLLFALAVLWTGNLHFIHAWPYQFEPLHQALVNPSAVTWMTLGLILVVGIPSVALFKLLFHRSLNLRSSPRWGFWLGLVLWLIGLGICFSAGLHLLSLYNGVWI